MGITENKKIAELDVLWVRPETLHKKLSFYTKDAVVWDSVMRVIGYNKTNEARGIDEVGKFFSQLAAMPKVNVKIQNIFGERNKVAVEWVLSGGEGKAKFEIPCANLYDFEHGKIKSVRMQFDSAYFQEIIQKQSA